MFDSEFSSIEFAGMKLANRFAVAPMTRVSAQSNGRANELMLKHYRRYAEGGFALIITEGIFPDQDASQGYENQPGLADALQGESWRPIIREVHEQGAKIIAQLMHAGAQQQYNSFGKAPLGITEQKPVGKPLGLYGDQESWQDVKAMDESDFERVLNGFLHGLRNAKEAGFDGAELHGANGYLLHEILSTHFNTRDDKWGGDMQRRAQFVLEVVKAAREMAGKDFVLGIRLSQITITDPDYQWPEGEEGFAWLVQALADAGIDYIHTTDNHANRPALKDGTRSLAEVVRDAGVPLVVNGGIDDTNYAKMAAHYPGAVLALGKAALADPQFVEKVKDGDKPDELDFAMLQPLANLENEFRWREEQDS
ncbi:NADH:flavin oxidoreductase [Pseudidiomarina sp. 1APP75-32.1]|uniref:NADH:flavin oxidoreductase n=1 Tax=Pseudidiomarina terrestris TaxID=2820060 RepID=A0AAW7QUT6_9GAMM|nr:MULTISPECIES: NADH:flavin oxidoreductase [unclassified Pseudidiomarina]MDN7123952.1 NADH:flavin oxidoreductase [Pseudidiomarina sp. 1APP75-32.1]MDN7130452.1 NADH:flavin oxidoreductase [Pseudidiomarina sp. 1APR75-15]MDN7138708.1 NADH:flavin oxidoreductase [Pseudidiomarina sp. 1ASP75-14]MEA3588829.1 NADH:flavin oxidoreductase [Pseudidiomarina sp. 1APP75-27a]